MNNNESNNQYMLLFRGTDWTKALSPEQIQTVMNEWKSWFERLSAEGKVVVGHPLEPAAKVVSGKNGRIVSDGPFTEAKEAIAGFFSLSVDSYEEAVAIGKGCPGLEHGCIVEVRQVAETCPHSREAMEAQHAHAAA
jgi:hypothetical protein